MAPFSRVSVTERMGDTREGGHRPPSSSPKVGSRLGPSYDDSYQSCEYYYSDLNACANRHIGCGNSIAVVAERLAISRRVPRTMAANLLYNQF